MKRVRLGAVGLLVGSISTAGCLALNWDFSAGTASGVGGAGSTDTSSVSGETGAVVGTSSSISSSGGGCGNCPAGQHCGNLGKCELCPTWIASQPNVTFTVRAGSARDVFAIDASGNILRLDACTGNQLAASSVSAGYPEVAFSDKSTLVVTRANGPWQGYDTSTLIKTGNENFASAATFMGGGALGADGSDWLVGNVNYQATRVWRRQPGQTFCSQDLPQLVGYYGAAIAPISNGLLIGATKKVTVGSILARLDFSACPAGCGCLDAKPVFTQFDAGFEVFSIRVISGTTYVSGWSIQGSPQVGLFYALDGNFNLSWKRESNATTGKEVFGPAASDGVRLYVPLSRNYPLGQGLLSFLPLSNGSDTYVEIVNSHTVEDVTVADGGLVLIGGARQQGGGYVMSCSLHAANCPSLP